MRIRPLIHTTVDPEFEGEIKRLSREKKIPLGTLLEDAWLTFKGTPTPLSAARRQMLFGETTIKVSKRAA